MTKFKGFPAISELKYTQKVFQCPTCANNCEITQIDTPQGELYHGDTCERYSGKGRDKSSRYTDLFAQRKEILMSYQREVVDGRRTVGIPRVGTFNDLFPLWAGFFNYLGLNAVPSSATNKRIIEAGVNATTAEFCFPFKVAFGHFADLEGKVDYTLVPDVIQTFRSRYQSNGNPRDSGWDRSSTCPYTQNFGSIIVPNVVRENRGINPHLNLRAHEKGVVRELTNALEKAGEKFETAKVKAAFKKGCEDYFQFKERLRSAGKIALQDLQDKQKAVVLIGRPYTIYDDRINLSLSKKVLSLGFMPVPMDFLPLPEKDLAEKWGNEFSIQGQNSLNAARIIRENGLNAVFLDYFACGPDAFLEGFFSAELEKPCLVLQVDEHTADAGVVTRLEAFLDSI